MSRIIRLWNRFFLNASPLRTYSEINLLFFGLALFLWLLYGQNTLLMLPTSLIFFIIPCCGLYYAARVRIPAGRWWRHLSLDFLWLLIPTVGFNALILLYARGVLHLFLDSRPPEVINLVFIAILAFPYCFFRVAIRVGVWFNRLRQRRLLWSLVTSHLVAVALLQALIVLPIVVLLIASSDRFNFQLIELPDAPLVRAFYHLQMILPVIGMSILGATMVLIGWLPVSIVVSYFFARRIKRRLDALLEAAHAAGDGDYRVRVPVSGRDEIAKLQTDFNGMAANLEIKVRELRGEREKVDALFKSRRELMMNVSHELRTPIATVRAYLESAGRAQGGLPRLSAEDFAVIERETQRLQTLIEDLFALSRAEVDQLEMRRAPVDAGVFLRRLVSTVAPMAWRMNRVQVLADVGPGLPLMLVDEMRLEQALRNLIHNSLRYTPPGGVVMISAQQAPDGVRVAVRDTGSGIAPDLLPHIWERYTRDGENGGTGLGLTLVKAFVEAMEGQVDVESAVGEGTCFTLTLPQCPSAEPYLAVLQPEFATKLRQS